MTIDTQPYLRNCGALAHLPPLAGEHGSHNGQAESSRSDFSFTGPAAIIHSSWVVGLYAGAHQETSIRSCGAL